MKDRLLDTVTAFVLKASQRARLHKFSCDDAHLARVKHSVDDLASVAREQHR